MPRPRLRRAVVAILACLPLAAVQAQRAFTLDQVLSHPFPDSLTAAPTGSRIAWTLYERGARNVYVADGPDFRARRVTSHAPDDGQELTSLSFSDDGRHIVFVRGGDHGSNWSSEGNLQPNPASSPVEPKVQIWSVAVDGGAPRTIAEGDDPVVSKTGRVAFTRNRRIWVAPIDGSQAPAQLFFARGSSDSPAWSPDGATLAFVSSRDDHSFIGLFTSETEPIRYLAPTSSRDSSPRWSPDGRRIAFIRQPGRGGAPRSPLEQQPAPWAIWVADVATGSARQVWKSGEALRDSLPRVAGGANLHWASGDRLVFMSYQDGWPHLYSVAVSGGPATLLTPGSFMVEHVALTPDRRAIVYSANTGEDHLDRDRRHLFRVPVDAAKPVALTKGAGLEWSPVVTADGATIAYFGSDAQTPALPKAIPVSGGAPTMIAGDRLPADFPVSQLVTPEQVVVKSPDGSAVHGQLFRTPAGAERRPAVIFVHGGPPRQMLLGWHYMFYYANSYALSQYLASRGFIVLSVNYRLGIGYGHTFQYPDDGGARGAGEYQDVLAAGKYLQARADVDPKRLGIWGGSYGGYLTALALGRNSDVFAAGVDIHGVHDRVQPVNTDLLASAIVGDGITEADVKKALAVAWQSSPNSSVPTWKSPVLLIHGDDDRNVQFQQTVDLARRLAAKGVRVEELVIPDEIHDFLLHRNWLAVTKATAEFFERTLMRRTTSDQ